MAPDAVDEVDTLVVTNKCERLRAVQSDSPEECAAWGRRFPR